MLWCCCGKLHAVALLWQTAIVMQRGWVIAAADAHCKLSQLLPACCLAQLFAYPVGLVVRDCFIRSVHSCATCGVSLHCFIGHDCSCLSSMFSEQGDQPTAEQGSICIKACSRTRNVHGLNVTSKPISSLLFKPVKPLLPAADVAAWDTYSFRAVPASHLR